MKARTKKTVKEDKTGFDFDRAFLRYAVAGSAVIGLPLVAPAQTTTPQSISTLSGPTSIAVSFDGGPTDFTLGVGFVSNGNESYPQVYVTGPGTTSFLNGVSYDFNYPTAFASAGGVIGGANGATAPNGTLLKAFSGENIGYWGVAQGETGYLGVLFQDNGAQYLGWADITASGYYPQVNSCSDSCASAVPYASATINSIGYEQVAPEPGSIALMALGATGLAMLRKRRKTAN